MRQWLRYIQVTIGSKEWDSDKIDIDFNHPFSADKEEPDVSEITLYNLSDSSINSIRKGQAVLLNAGYKGSYQARESVGNILQGVVESVDTERTETDKITTVTVSDDGIKWRLSTLSKTYQAGSTASMIMNDLILYMGMDIGRLEPVRDKTYPRGYTVKGNINNALKRLVKDTKSKMYTNKGKVYIGASNKAIETSFVLEAKSGLLKTPEREIEEEEVGEGDKKKTKETIFWNVECQLHHEIDKGHKVKIKSQSINGWYKVVSGVHKGDFITELKVQKV